MKTVICLSLLSLALIEAVMGAWFPRADMVADWLVPFYFSRDESRLTLSMDLIVGSANFSV